ncbi:hypothetical protein [Bordetella bronchialis]|uniref:hypothetical protein n=1 Tax=Bordetella bronchialis TaxID=463025 RepID=UPI0012E9FDEF|nr:hypothetical protein [Bordetella bronchialis]
MNAFRGRFLQPTCGSGRLPRVFTEAFLQETPMLADLVFNIRANAIPLVVLFAFIAAVVG